MRDWPCLNPAAGFTNSQATIYYSTIQYRYRCVFRCLKSTARSYSKYFRSRKLLTFRQFVKSLGIPTSNGRNSCLDK